MKSDTDTLDILARSTSHRARPFFSFCIPQFNRTSFLIESCRSLAGQSFTSFEVCIVDDRSTDGREDEIIRFLDQSGLDFTYARQKVNRRYDGNLRSAISLACGRFVFLLGNDDRLASGETLQTIHDEILRIDSPGVAVTNYRESGTGHVFRRVARSGVLGTGPEAAAKAFRNFSFVSGVILETEAAHRFATDKWDGSEMYQMYLGCRILASGGALAGIGEICIEKDIQLPGEGVDSYATRKILKTDFSPVELPMSQICPLVNDAIGPFLSPSDRGKVAARIAAQLILFTYAFWLIEMRRVQSWKYAVAVYRGLKPKTILADVSVNAPDRILIAFLYVIVGLGGLLAPVGLFRVLRPLLYRIAKR